MTLTDLQRDILVKAAEGIQEGMWCRGTLFEDESLEEQINPNDLIKGLRFSDALKVERCALGELMLRTGLAGGSYDDLLAIQVAVERSQNDHECADLTFHNDVCMDSLDVFTAGQEWARIFREVADA